MALPVAARPVLVARHGAPVLPEMPPVLLKRRDAGRIWTNSNSVTGSWKPGSVQGMKKTVKQQVGTAYRVSGTGRDTQE